MYFLTFSVRLNRLNFQLVTAWVGFYSHFASVRKNLITTILVLTVQLGGWMWAADSSVGFEFFERKIRPLLTENCYECHGPENKVKGGLRLDSREGWVKGGESGPALVPGEMEKSRLITAVRYRDKEFQMPPKRRLSDAQIADLEQWVKMGAPDPRTALAPATIKKTGMSLDEGRKFWAYQPVKSVVPSSVTNVNWPRNDIDRFILARIEANNLKPTIDADRVTLVRRIYYDLLGLPPTPAQIDEFANANSPDAYTRLVDRLLASPQFGERWGRHWLDVARFAESMTLRGFIFKEAWRYRDYVIESFNNDRPFNQFLREQIAGDLLPSASLENQRRQVVATTFLALGNYNLEEQDKKQLVMDVVDEQIDVISKALLGQTVSCARCHDHKFDPIPTRDYYALAGILKSTRTLDHSNVSKWLEMPLPGTAAEEALFKKHEKAAGVLQAQIKAAKEAKTLVSKIEKPSRLAISSLPGIVVDDAKAKRVGEWTASQFSGHFVGDGYLHDANTDKGNKSLTFLPELPRAGLYEVRFAYTAGTNRAENVPVTVFSADGEKTLHVNERQAPVIDAHFISLGQFRFELNGQGFVIIGNEDTKGHVTADAVQFIPVEKAEAVPPPGAPPIAAPSKIPADDIKRLEAELKELNERGPARPMYMTVREESDINDTQIHVRGSVHNLGDKVPRGFLQIASHSAAPTLPVSQSGRLELANWISSESNPLTARVFANRAWHWLHGSGLVRTTDNFGTTGERPSHPELIDYLAARFVKEGWSVKKLVREIVLSRTYQLASVATAAQNKSDPENRFYSHANRRRLDAEQLRDTLLMAGGRLDLAIGGATIKPNTAADYAYKHTDTRRSVYTPVLRNSLPELFEVFDFADPSTVTGRRNTSTVAPQALYLLNHPFVHEQSLATAQLLLSQKTLADDIQRINHAYRLSLGRLPTGAERQIALKHLAASAVNPTAAWTQLIQALFASPDFRYVN